MKLYLRGSEMCEEHVMSQSMFREILTKCIKNYNPNEIFVCLGGHLQCLDDEIFKPVLQDLGIKYHGQGALSYRDLAIGYDCFLLLLHSSKIFNEEDLLREIKKQNKKVCIYKYD